MTSIAGSSPTQFPFNSTMEAAGQESNR
jgi:hypothetical protein